MCAEPIYSAVPSAGVLASCWLGLVINDHSESFAAIVSTYGTLLLARPFTGSGYMSNAALRK